MQSYNNCATSSYTDVKSINFTILLKEEEISQLPKEFALKPNYPNPFNPSTKITLELPRDTNVEITIYDEAGRKVRDLYKGILKAGVRDLEWDGKNGSNVPASSGVYFYRIEYPENGQMRVMKGKMLLMK